MVSIRSTFDPDKDIRSEGTLRPNVYAVFDPIVDPSNNVLRFNRRTSVAEIPYDYVPVSTSYLGGDLVFRDHFVKNYTNDALRNRLSVINSFFKQAMSASFSIPEINVLAISNLLFPERNALQLTQARLPGDLAMFGHIDPKETTFTLDPLLPVIKAGEQQTFSIRQLGHRAAEVKWTVRGVDGSRAQGTIEGDAATAEYVAPDALLLNGNAVRNVVTATYTDPTTNKEVTASALVVVVLAGLVVTPSMSQIDMQDSQRRSVTLKATSLSGATLNWKLLGTQPGSLEFKGNEAIYTAPTTPLGKTLESVLIEVEDPASKEKAIATVLLREGAFSLAITPAFHPGLSASATALFSAPPGIPPEQQTWEVVAGEGSIVAGLFTAPALITVPYSVVKCTVAGVVSGYSIIHLSDHARQSNWYELDVFQFEVTEIAPTVYANGLQQAKVVVRVRPTDVAGKPVELSPSEKTSVRLISAHEKNPLPEVGTDGVPEGGKWHYTESYNPLYLPYPGKSLATTSTSLENQPDNVWSKIFYVQCHDISTLKVAARLMSDNHQPFYSNPSPNDDDDSKKVITFYSVEAPHAGSVGSVKFSFGDKPFRAYGGENDENDLNTVDYYYLKLLIKNVQVAIKRIEFEGHCSLAMWESNTLLEDVHSITGYAVPDEKDEQGNTILHFDDVLWRRLKGVSPHQIIKPGTSVPEGQVIISLHRREYWQYDRYVNSDFLTHLNAIVHDVYGNRHRVRISFNGVDRNKLMIIGQ
jgi:hypothetical protein